MGWKFQSAKQGAAISAFEKECLFPIIKHCDMSKEGAIVSEPNSSITILGSVY